MLSSEVVITCHFMALCSYVTLVGEATPCGKSPDYPGQLECVTLEDCTKDVTGHLSTLGLSADEGSRTEMKLLLARVGKYFSTDFCVFLVNFIVLMNGSCNRFRSCYIFYGCFLNRANTS